MLDSGAPVYLKLRKLAVLRCQGILVRTTSTFIFATTRYDCLNCIVFFFTDTDSTICGGCLAGSYLGDNYDNTRNQGYYLNTASATITVEVTTKSSDCQDAACFQALYNSIVADFSSFLSSGSLTNEIVSWAQVCLFI